MAFPLSLLLSAKVQSQLVSFAKSLPILSQHFFFEGKESTAMVVGYRWDGILSTRL